MGVALRARGLTKTFGGLRAVDDVSFEVEESAITALIGPNGAGKTTLFNVVTSLVKPDAGSVELFGANVTGLPADKLARLGLVRTFQTARVFPGMSSLDNVMTGAHLALERSWREPFGSVQAGRVAQARARALLELVGVRADDLHRAATELPMGTQKLIEVLRSLMLAPRVLLLDEPAAGLNDTETRELAELLAAVQELGTTIVVVEHNMSLVMGIAKHVVVLQTGRLLAQGTPAQVSADPRVVEAYLGTPAETATC